MESNDGKALFLERLGLIEELIAGLAARHQLSEDERQEIYSLVMLKVIQDDYAVLRRFRAQSRWSTYLTVVIQRVLLDERTRRWGRWRPCAAARRLGRTAVELDRWIHREGLEREEAVQMMLVGEWGTDVGELRRLVEQIPTRARHRARVSDGCLVSHAGGPGADRRLEVAEETDVAGRLSAALRSALAELSARDLELLDLRFGKGRTVRQIAADLELDRRPLYRRFERILRRLRWRLESLGLTWEEVREALSDPDVGLELEPAVFSPGEEGRMPPRSRISRAEAARGSRKNGRVHGSRRTKGREAAAEGRPSRRRSLAVRAC